MTVHKPSPALVVSIVALVVAMGGTAVAAKVLITSSSQIKNQTIRGVDLQKGAITKSRLNKRVRSAVYGGGDSISGSSVGGSSTSGSGGGRALEAHRLAGPDMPEGGSAQVTSLALPAGSYAVFAKATLVSYIHDNGLLNTLFKDNKTIAGSCSLDVGGTGDFAIGAIVTPGSAAPVTLNTQATRTVDEPSTATLTCEAENVSWKAADASIIAIEVASGERVETGG